MYFQLIVTDCIWKNHLALVCLLTWTSCDWQRASTIGWMCNWEDNMRSREAESGSKTLSLVSSRLSCCCWMQQITASEDCLVLLSENVHSLLFILPWQLCIHCFQWHSEEKRQRWMSVAYLAKLKDKCPQSWSACLKLSEHWNYVKVIKG